MKKILLFTLSLLIFSCAAVNPSILMAVNEPLPKKLHNLKIGLGESAVFRPESIKTVTVQSDFATILSRELESNVFDNSRRNWGYIEYKIVFDSYNIKPISYLLYAFQGLWLFIPSVIGIPLEQRVRTLEAEISIYDINEVQLKKYILSSTSEPKFVNLYNSMSDWNPKRKSGVEVTKDIIKQLKSKLLYDIDYLNKELEAAAPIG